MSVANGTYKAKASGEVVLGESKEKKTPFVELYFSISKGDSLGGLVRWTGYFSENTNERTIQSLQTMGWKGDNLAEFADGALHGLDANEVDIVVENEEYEKDGETRRSPRVQWVNRAGGYLNKETAMSHEAAQSFGNRLQGLVLKMREKLPKGDTSFSFGANAETPSVSANGPKAF